MKCDCCKSVEIEYYDKDASFCDECIDILDTAEEAISIARQVGVPMYNATSWRDVPVQEHLNHAIAHARLAYSMKDKTEDHLSHAICRLVMAKALTDAS